MTFLKKGMVLVTACLMILSGCKKETDNKADVLKIGTSADYPPFFFYKNGALTGFEHDLITEIATRLNKKADINDMGFDGLIGGLQTKRIQMAISAMSATKDRMKSVDFSDSYHKSYTVLLVGKDSEIQSEKDLKGIHVGVQSGSTYEMWLNKKMKKIFSDLKVKSLIKIPDLVQDYKAGRLQGIVMGIREAKGVLIAHPEFKIVDIDDEETEVSYAMAFPKGSSLKNNINAILKDLKQEGFLKQLEKKWGL